MSSILTRRRQRVEPPSITVPEVSQYWVERGLRVFNVLNMDLWDVNLVTGRTNGSLVGAGHTFYDNKIRTSGATGQYVNLSLDGYSAVAPFTVIAGCKHISGSVDWSLLRRDTAVWYGMYHTIGQTIVSNNNDFAGSVTPSGGIPLNSAFDYHSAGIGGSNNLRASVNGSILSVDTALTAPTGGGLNNVSLGCAVKTLIDNEAVADFEYWGIFDRLLMDDEFQDLTENPWRILLPQERKIFVSVAAGATVQTLTTAAFDFVPNAIQNTAALTLTAAAFDFTPNAMQNTAAATLTAAAFDFVAQDLTLTYSSGASVDLNVTTFDFVPNAIQNTAAATLSAATFGFAANDAQIQNTLNLSAAAISFVPQDISHQLVLHLNNGTFNFTAKSITAGDPLAGSGRATNLMLMGVGN